MGDGLGGEIDHRDATVTELGPADLVRAAIGHVQALAVAAGVKAVGAEAGWR